MNTEYLEGYTKSRCYALLNLKERYLQSKERFFRFADQSRSDSDICSSYTLECFNNMRDAYHLYIERRFELIQFAHVLGNEYVEIYKSIIGDDDNGADVEDKE